MKFLGKLQRRAKVLMLLVLIVIAILASGLSRGGLLRQWEAKPVCSIDEPQLVDIWFGSPDQLVTVGLQDSTVSVKKWSLSCVRLEESLNVDLLRLSSPTNIHPRVLPRYGLRASVATVKSMPRTWFPFVVSPDGQRLAWSVIGALYIKESSTDALKRLQLDPGKDVVSLSFSAEKTLSLLREDGALEHWDLSLGSKGVAGAKLSQGWSFWSQGPHLGVAAFASGEVGLIDVGSPNGNNVLKNTIGFKNGSAMTLSPDQAPLPVIGTRDGKVVTFVYKPRRGFAADRSFPLPETRPVRSLSFFSKDFLLVGGEFQSIFIVGRENVDAGAKSVMDARNGTRVLAVKQRHIAVLTPDEVILGELANPLRLTPLGVLYLMFFSVSMSLLSIGYNIIRDKQ